IFITENIQFDLMCVSYGLIIIQFFLQFFSEPVILQYDIHISTKKSSPEIKASFPSKVTFHWMTSFIWQGYRKSLTPEDIWELPDYLKSRHIVPEFQKAWDKEKHKIYLRIKQLTSGGLYDDLSGETTHLLKVQPKMSNIPKLSPSLLKALFKTYAPELLRAHAMRLGADSLQFVLPILTNLLIGFVETRERHTA
ncbi:unnamed protein product, partial [Lymnaea stagnalis]